MTSTNYPSTCTPWHRHTRVGAHAHTHIRILERDSTASRPETDMWLSGKVPASYVQGLGLRPQYGKQAKTGRTVEAAQLVKSSVCNEEPSSMLRTCVKNLDLKCVPIVSTLGR